MTLRLTVALLVAATSGLFAASQAQPQPPPQGAAPAQNAPAQPAQPAVTFRVEVNYVEVDAIVTDAQGRVVSDLTAADFDVIEDGKAQKVTSFSRVSIPIERPERPIFASTPIEADVQTNEHAEGRIYLIVLDDVHTDITRTPRVKTSMRRFLEQNFGANDLAAVVFTGRSEASQDFTNNTKLLLNAVDKFQGSKLRSSTLQRLEGARVNPNSNTLEAGDDIDQQDRAFRARSVMANIRKLAEFMAGVHGRRKSLLLIGEGVDYNIYDATGILGATASSVLLDTQDAIAAATRGNVAIYAIDPRGLSTGDEDLIQTSSTLDGADSRSIQNELRLSQESLRVLASSTGGFAAVNRNDMNEAFDRIVQENSSYYLFGYYSTNERRDGRYRKIEVKSKNPRLQVRARKGYFEARGGKRVPPPSASATPPAITAAIGSPLPVAGVPMKMFAAAYKGQAPDAAVAYAVEIDVNGFDFVEKDGSFVEQLEIVNTATDSKGKVFPGDRQTVNLTMKADTYARVKSRGFRMVSQANLPPGRYQMRVAAGNKGGKAGSVIYDLVVPDFQNAPFTMSGVSITSRQSSEAPTIRPKNPLGDYLPGPPTASRTFARNDEIALFAEFYENKPAAPTHMLDFKAELRAEGGTVVRTVADERSSTELQGKSGGYGFAARMPLDDVAPGIYVLHVEGRSRTKDVQTVSRDIQVTVK